MPDAAAVGGQGADQGPRAPACIAKIIRDDFSTNANHIVLKPKKKRFTPGLPLDYKEAICYDSDESSEGDLFDDLEVLGEEG